MHVAKIRTVQGDKVYESYLIRRSYREDGKVKHQTIANITHLPLPVIEVIRRALQGQTVVPVAEAFTIVESRHHGHVQAVLTAMKHLGIAELIASRPCRERDLVLAMIVARILAPDSKLAHTRWWPTTTLLDELGLGQTHVAEVYKALDWLIERQDRIEKKLAARHFTEGCLALYDMSSSYFEGLSCSLAAPGYSRDRKRSKLQVNYGLLTDSDGRPVAISLFPGNTTDAKTLTWQADWIREQYGLASVVLVGDRGMIGQQQIKELQAMKNMYWVTALKHSQIRKLEQSGAIDLLRFDDASYFETASESYPGERLVACRNPELAREETQTRRGLFHSTVEELTKVAKLVTGRRLRGQDAIGLRAGKVVNRFKVGKFFRFLIADDTFAFHIDEAAVAQEARLDGIYVIRTNLPPERADAAECVRIYKRLARVERAFRSMKTVDLHVRPIRHSLEDRVRAHFFVAMLAYYVEWYLRRAWKTLLFDDEHPAQMADPVAPVAPAARSKAALAKAEKRQTPDGTEVHSFRTLLQSLATVVRNTCRYPGSGTNADFQVLTIPTDEQQRALRLVEAIEM